ncbi:MAG: diaminopimelate decarboxylase [Chloroflexi bacterium]|nr:MAG: diaminopimelate decarboxylase [Chloroflexota bacterium]
MSDKHLFLKGERLDEILHTYPTPFHLYDERGIRESCRQLLNAFSWNAGFKEYFAVKATPNPAILGILAEEGLGVDCSSMAELVLAERCGFRGEDIMFTSNNTPAHEFQKAMELGAIINLDDLSHVSFLEQHAGLPDLLCFRYNPGAIKSGNVIIGHPEEAKFGLTREQLFAAFGMARDKGVTRFGLHTMVASNELNVDYFVETAVILFQLVTELSNTLGITFEFVNLGGGLGIPYHPDQQPVDLVRLSAGIRRAYEAAGLDGVRVCMENGRFITGPNGCLVTRVRHLKHTYKNYVGLDASMADLMRPGLYGAYHHITVLGKADQPHNHCYDVTGSLCENNDKFAINRQLPAINIGDALIIHDTGAHGHAMGFNYNGKLRAAERLLRENGEVTLIRRAETLDDYFATLNF